MTNETLTDKIAAYIQTRAQVKLEKLDKEAAQQRKKITDVNQLTTFELDFKAERQKVAESFAPANWLTDAARRAQWLSLATHVLKFTHVDARGSNIYTTFNKNQSDYKVIGCYLTTDTLQTYSIDSACQTAAALDVATLLQLQTENNPSLIESLARNDNSSLQLLATSEAELQRWIIGFKQVLADKDLSSHTLAKQIFFPVNATEYHVLSPLFAASLAAALHQRITDSRYAETAKIAKKAKYEQKYYPDPIIHYSNILTQKFGSTKPQIISQLNSRHRGKFYLLSCAPPLWKNITKPPLNTKSIFNSEYNRRARQQALRLKQYLLTGPKRNITTRDRRKEYVSNLIDILLIYAAEVRNMEPAGWSIDSQLPFEQQLWLDPNRSDEVFKQARAKNEWQRKIANQFASWLNKKIKSDQLKMADAEHFEWQRLLKRALKLLREDLEVITS